MAKGNGLGDATTSKFMTHTLKVQANRAAQFFIVLSLGFTHITLAVSPGQTLWHGNRAIPKIAITFDDGPKPEVTYPLLDILQKYNVKATFLVVGKWAKLYPDALIRMSDEGHEIGNHSYSHPRLSTLTPTEIEYEIQKTNTIITTITKKPPLFFRPPGGQLTKTMMKLCQKNGLRIAMWDVNPGDYFIETSIVIPNEANSSKSAQDVIESILLKTQNGSIILLHNGYSETLNAIETVIQTLKKQGFQFVTLSELDPS